MRRYPEIGEAGSELTQQVVVIYENPTSRDEAKDFCGHISECRRAHLDVHWCSFASLADFPSADEALRKAATADLVVFSITCEGDFPQEIKMWIERWLAKRTEREGAVVGLISDRTRHPSDIAPLKEVYLRHMAQRAGLDYLSHATPACAIPDSIESYNRRAGQVTSVLDEILHTQPLPAGYR